MPRRKITKLSTMAEVLAAFPSASRTLFRFLRVAGCQNRGFEPDEPFEAMALRHQRNAEELLAVVLSAHQRDERSQMSSRELSARLRAPGRPCVIDARSQAEWRLAHLPDARPLSDALIETMRSWPRATPIVFYCLDGKKSPGIVSYFLDHGFTNLRWLTGGFQAWSFEIETIAPGDASKVDPIHEQEPAKLARWDDSRSLEYRGNA